MLQRRENPKGASCIASIDMRVSLHSNITASLECKKEKNAYWQALSSHVLSSPIQGIHFWNICL